MAAGQLSRPSPATLHRWWPRTALVMEKVVPGAGYSTSSPLHCRSPAVAGPPAPAAVVVGQHPIVYLSSMEVQVPSPPPDVATGVQLQGTDSDCSKAVPLLLLPATKGVGLQETDDDSTSSMEVPQPRRRPAPDAAAGVGLLAAGHRSGRSPVPSSLRRSLRAVTCPFIAAPFTCWPGAPPQYGSSAVAKPCLRAAGIGSIVNGRPGFERSTLYLCKVFILSRIRCLFLYFMAFTVLMRNKLL